MTVSVLVSEELKQKLAEATVDTAKAVNEIAKQCTKLPSGGSGSPTLFGNTRRKAAKGQNSQVLEECSSVLRQQAKELSDTIQLTSNLGLGSSQGDNALDI